MFRLGKVARRKNLAASVRRGLQSGKHFFCDVSRNRTARFTDNGFTGKVSEPHAHGIGGTRTQSNKALILICRSRFEHGRKVRFEHGRKTESFYARFAVGQNRTDNARAVRRIYARRRKIVVYRIGRRISRAKCFSAAAGIFEQAKRNNRSVARKNAECPHQFIQGYPSASEREGKSRVESLCAYRIEMQFIERVGIKSFADRIQKAYGRHV